MKYPPKSLARSLSVSVLLIGIVLGQAAFAQSRSSLTIGGVVRPFISLSLIEPSEAWMGGDGGSSLSLVIDSNSAEGFDVLLSDGQQLGASNDPAENSGSLYVIAAILGENQVVRIRPRHEMQRVWSEVSPKKRSPSAQGSSKGRVVIPLKASPSGEKQVMTVTLRAR